MTPGDPQFSIRAVAAGSLLGALVLSMNLYFGLRTGWSVDGSIVSAVLAFMAFRLVRAKRPLSIFETNLAQTAGSAAGTMATAAGLLSAIPAMELSGRTFGWFELALWTGSVAWLGIFFAVPLRRRMLGAEGLVFPSGRATADTIRALHSGPAEARSARALVWFALAAAAFTLGRHFAPKIESPPLHVWFPFLGVAAAYSFTLLVSPMMFGAGGLAGLRIGTSLLIGSILGWGLLAPWVERQGWVGPQTMSYASGARGWILWVGVGVMVAEALAQLALDSRLVLATFRARGAPAAAGAESIPTAWWVLGLAGASAATTAAARHVFGIPVAMSLLAIALSAVLAAIAIRVVGETNFNPVGGLGKVTQLVYGAIAPGRFETNLMTAAITAAGAAQAGDVMQDLETGRILGASPRRQLLAQLAGAAVGVAAGVPIYRLLVAAHGLGGTVLPAPGAQAWKAMADVLTQGLGALPPGAPAGVAVGAAVGVLLPSLRRGIPRLEPYVPSGLAIGLAFILPASYSIAVFLGAAAFALAARRAPARAGALGYAASGLVAGEGLMGVATSVLALMGIPGG